MERRLTCTKIDESHLHSKLSNDLSDLLRCGGTAVDFHDLNAMVKRTVCAKRYFSTSPDGLHIKRESNIALLGTCKFANKNSFHWENRSDSESLLFERCLSTSSSCKINIPGVMLLFFWWTIRAHGHTLGKSNSILYSCYFLFIAPFNDILFTYSSEKKYFFAIRGIFIGTRCVTYCSFFERPNNKLVSRPLLIWILSTSFAWSVEKSTFLSSNWRYS